MQLMCLCASVSQECPLFLVSNYLNMMSNMHKTRMDCSSVISACDHSNCWARHQYMDHDSNTPLWHLCHLTAEHAIDVTSAPFVYAVALSCCCRLLGDVNFCVTGTSFGSSIKWNSLFPRAFKTHPQRHAVQNTPHRSGQLFPAFLTLWQIQHFSSSSSAFMCTGETWRLIILMRKRDMFTKLESNGSDGGLLILWLYFM